MFSTITLYQSETVPSLRKVCRGISVCYNNYVCCLNDLLVLYKLSNQIMMTICQSLFGQPIINECSNEVSMKSWKWLLRNSPYKKGGRTAIIATLHTLELFFGGSIKRWIVENRSYPTSSQRIVLLYCFIFQLTNQIQNKNI